MPTTAEYKNYLFVQVDPDSYGYEVFYHKTPYIDFYIHNGVGGEISLPFGSWQIIGKGDQLGIEFWEPILEHLDLSDREDAAFMYKNYVDGNFNLTNWKDARHSLLRSLEMEPGTTLVLKKNEK